MKFYKVSYLLMQLNYIFFILTNKINIFQKLNLFWYSQNKKRRYLQQNKQTIDEAFNLLCHCALK